MRYVKNYCNIFLAEYSKKKIKNNKDIGKINKEMQFKQFNTICNTRFASVMFILSQF